ncbi:MAG: hypothetical protein K6T85_03770 [Gorillibacterium sp.]|nr:hypothetical protein [Gorillibacterium sp.]
MATQSSKWIVGGLALTLALGGGGMVYAAEGTEVLSASIVQAQPEIAVDKLATALKPDQQLRERQTDTQRSLNKGEHRSDGSAGEHRSYVDAAAVIGLTVDELKEQLKSGKSLADVALEKGITKDKLIVELTTKTTVRLDEAVKNGKMTKETAERLKSKLADKWTKRVETKGLTFADKGPKHDGRMHKMGGQFARIAAIIGISKDELDKQLQEGKSLAEIASAHGITRDELIAKIKEDLTPMLEKMIDAKHATKTEPKASDSIKK